MLQTKPLLGHCGRAVESVHNFELDQKNLIAECLSPRSLVVLTYHAKLCQAKSSGPNVECQLVPTAKLAHLGFMLILAKI